jgi:hypothetical protein
MYLKEIGCEDEDWIQLALVNMTTFVCHKKQGYFLTTDRLANPNLALPKYRFIRTGCKKIDKRKILIYSDEY